MQPRRFILQAIDPDYGHPAFETMFVVERLEELRSVLGVSVDADPDFDRWYNLEPDELVAICDHFGISFDGQGREVWLRSWISSREVPYLVHTGYELVLMVEGRKQFARMSDAYPPGRHEHEDRFDYYVAQGLLHKEVELEPFAEPVCKEDGQVLEGLRTVYYTRTGEEWRIPAWKMIASAALKSRWNEDFERLEGMLFGYDEWQSDWWIDLYRKRRPA